MVRCPCGLRKEAWSCARVVTRRAALGAAAAPPGSLTLLECDASNGSACRAAAAAAAPNVVEAPEGEPPSGTSPLRGPGVDSVVGLVVPATSNGKGAGSPPPEGGNGRRAADEVAAALAVSNAERSALAARLAALEGELAVREEARRACGEKGAPNTPPTLPPHPTLQDTQSQLVEARAREAQGLRKRVVGSPPAPPSLAAPEPSKAVGGEGPALWQLVVLFVIVFVLGRLTGQLGQPAKV